MTKKIVFKNFKQLFFKGNFDFKKAKLILFKFANFGIKTFKKNIAWSEMIGFTLYYLKLQIFFYYFLEFIMGKYYQVEIIFIQKFLETKKFQLSTYIQIFQDVL